MCERSKVEIWIKNPIYPEKKLWIGAIERFKNTGVKEIKAIQRLLFYI